MKLFVRRTYLLASITGTFAILASGNSAKALFGFDPIIFDPQALVEHVQQIAKVAQQIQTAAQQVQNQVKELTHISPNIAPDVNAAVGQVKAQLNASVYGASDASGQLAAQFPTDVAGMTAQQYRALETQWTQQYRDALVENRQLENRVVQNMSQTNTQVEQIVQASNAAPGETTAVQAHNDLLAVLSRELSELNTLKLARSRAKADRLARQQSENAYGQAQRDKVRAGWDNPPKPTTTVTAPFDN